MVVFAVQVGQMGVEIGSETLRLTRSFAQSGPKRYDYDETRKVWVYHRDGSTLHSLLDEELSELLGMTIKVPVA